MTPSTKQGAGQKFHFQGTLESIKALWQKDKKSVIQQGIMILGVLVLLFVVLIPLSARNHFLKVKIREATREIATAEIKIKRAPEFKHQLELYGKQMEAIENRFFQIRDLDQLLGDLSKLAANDNVVITGSKPLSDQAKALPEPYQKKYFPVSYELILAGGYHDFGKFINDVEQFEKLILIREISIQQNAAKQGRKLQATVQVTAFVRAPEGLK